MNDTVETQEALQQEPQQEPQSKDADLNINDLSMIRGIIDLASSRGAFKAGPEMIAVGQTYSKLNTFLENVAAQAKQAEEAAK